MKRLLLSAALLLMTTPAFASNVSWNFVSSFYSANGSTNVEAQPTDTLWVSLIVETSGTGQNVVLQNPSCNLMTVITWTMMAVDDIVGASAFGDGKESFFSSSYSSASGTLTVTKGSDFYLGFEVRELIQDDPLSPDPQYYEGEKKYGWVELHADSADQLSLVNSAIDLDGGAMYVGGGAVPEPTSGLLILLGAAALALRRKLVSHAL